MRFWKESDSLPEALWLMDHCLGLEMHCLSSRCVPARLAAIPALQTLCLQTELASYIAAFECQILVSVRCCWVQVLLFLHVQTDVVAATLNEQLINTVSES